MNTGQQVSLQKHTFLFEEKDVTRQPHTHTDVYAYTHTGVHTNVYMKHTCFETHMHTYKGIHTHTRSIAAQALIAAALHQRCLLPSARQMRIAWPSIKALSYTAAAPSNRLSGMCARDWTAKQSTRYALCACCIHWYGIFPDTHMYMDACICKHATISWDEHLPWCAWSLAWASSNVVSACQSECVRQTTSIYRFVKIVNMSPCL